MQFQDLLANTHKDCNMIEVHVTRSVHSSDTSLGLVHVDLPRDRMVEMMRSAMRARSLSSCENRQERLQSTHMGDLTLERTLGQRSRERVESSVLRSVTTHHRGALPLVWMEWTQRRLPSACFPCTTEHDDVRHCIRRTITCGEGVSLIFETHMNETCRAVYRVWIQVTDVLNFVAASVAMERALDALNLTG